MGTQEDHSWSTTSNLYLPCCKQKMNTVNQCKKQCKISAYNKEIKRIMICWKNCNIWINLFLENCTVSCTPPRALLHQLQPLFHILSRYLLPFWRTKRGGGLPQPERHQPSASAPPLETDLLLRPSTPGLCSCNLGGQRCKQEGSTGGFLHQGQGEPYRQTGSHHGPHLSIS